LSTEIKKTTIYDELINTFKTHKYQVDVNNDVFIEKVIDDVVHQREALIKLMLSNETLKNTFFKKIADAFVFNAKALIEVLSAENRYLESRTTYSQSIGLTKKDDFIKTNDDVVLSFPFKDTVFVGGQEKDDEKSNENFLQNTINSNEIVRLFEPKVMTNIKRYSKDKVESNPNITINDNLIIKGNNLLALHSLLDKADGEALYRGKVKLIYIDPPYNTGNDSFNYNDNFSHSTWLTFMKNRLEVAREFLSDDGVIFIQCDDNEQAYLKVLMDEIFGRNEFLTCVVWRKTDNQANIGNIARVKEYIFAYSNNSNIFKFNKIELSTKAKNEYSYEDKFGLFRRKNILDKSRGKRTYKIEAPSGDILFGPWMIDEEEFKELDKQGKIYWANNKTPYGKKYLHEAKGQIPNDLWGIEVGSNQQGAKHIEQLFNERKFAFSKPEGLIQRIIEISTQKGDLVMDYHLGSGTTCAVAHKMGRRYIGIEQMDYIEEVAVERMKKVIEGEQGGISKSVDWKGGGEFVYMELKELDEYKGTELENEMRYLPIEEIEDETYDISKEEREANFAFYGIDTKRG
jgi:adenine-specific DNA-methyltransferase